MPSEEPPDSFRESKIQKRTRTAKIGVQTKPSLCNTKHKTQSIQANDGMSKIRRVTTYA